MQLPEHAIDLWRIPLVVRPGDRELLAERERQRADRLVVDDKREQFIAAQAGLRRVLASYLKMPAATVEFAYGEHGKPSVATHPGVGFNMTHSADLALVAVAAGLRIGVDLEWARRERPFLRLARRYFTSGEHDWLAGVPEGRRPEAFYRTWTLKEAYLKAVGTGLTVPPDRFELDLDRSPGALRSTELPGDRAEAWCFAEPAVGRDYAAALCWEGTALPVIARDGSGLAAVADR